MVTEPITRYRKDYSYVGRMYGIQPRYGERVRDGRQEGIVKRERAGKGAHVAVQFAGERRVSYCHPQDLEYLERDRAEQPWLPERKQETE